MVLLSLFIPKKRKLKKALHRVKKGMDKSFPNGELDINSAGKELQRILGYRISRDEAKKIIRLSVGIRVISKDLSIERLRNHLAGYCLHNFTDSTLQEFHHYLNTLHFALSFHEKSPSEIRREGDAYVW